MSFHALNLPTPFTLHVHIQNASMKCASITRSLRTTGPLAPYVHHVHIDNPSPRVTTWGKNRRAAPKIRTRFFGEAGERLSSSSSRLSSDEVGTSRTQLHFTHSHTSLPFTTVAQEAPINRRLVPSNLPPLATQQRHNLHSPSKAQVRQLPRVRRGVIQLEVLSPTLLVHSRRSQPPSPQLRPATRQP